MKASVVGVVGMFVNSSSTATLQEYLDLSGVVNDVTTTTSDLSEVTMVITVNLNRYLERCMELS